MISGQIKPVYNGSSLIVDGQSFTCNKYDKKTKTSYYRCMFYKSKKCQSKVQVKNIHISNYLGEREESRVFWKKDTIVHNHTNEDSVQSFKKSVALDLMKDKVKNANLSSVQAYNSVLREYEGSQHLFKNSRQVESTLRRAKGKKNQNPQCVTEITDCLVDTPFELNWEGYIQSQNVETSDETLPSTITFDNEKSLFNQLEQINSTIDKLENIKKSISHQILSDSQGVSKKLFKCVTERGNVIFCSDTGLKILCESDDILVDGTFKSTPVLKSKKPGVSNFPWYQVFTIHGCKHNPIEKTSAIFCNVIALLTSKETEEYEEVFDFLKQEFSRLGLKPKAVEISRDYESAIKKAIKRSWSCYDICQTGCLFHFAQSVLRKIQTLGLIKLYKKPKMNEEVFKSSVKRLILCSLLPEEKQVFYNDCVSH